MIRIGVLGCGRIGQVHAMCIKALDGVRLVAVSDFVDEMAHSVANKTGAEVRSSDEIIASDDIDAVVICTPTDTHFDLIHLAARHKRAIFCEKPIDMSVDNIIACKRVVEDEGVPFMAGFNRRFDPNFAQIVRRLREGEIGKTELVMITSRDPAPPPISYIKSSGGLFRDMMIHDFDMARFLIGGEFVRIHAVGSALVDPAIGAADDVDTAAVILSTADGRICQISNSRRATYGYDQRIEVHGERGMLRAENQYETTVEVATSDGFRRSPTQHFFLERYQEAYMAEMRAFISAINDGTTPTPDLEDGLRAQEMADAAALALETGLPVDLTHA